MRRLCRLCAILAVLVVHSPALANDGDASSGGDGTEFGPLSLHQVSNGTYALIGPTGGRTAENHALNANFGFVVTGDGVAVIDSGASPAGAELIHRAVQQTTDQPVRWVINTGAQDHRWLGNSYFKARGARILALQATVDSQTAFAEQHLQRLKTTLESREAAAIVPVHAEQPRTGDRARLALGDRTLELRRFGDAHFPGDAVVWLPQAQVLFAGDHIYVDRLLGIHPFSDVQAWQQAVHAALDLGPEVIVPGHGGLADPDTARAHTADYLDWLTTQVAEAVENWEPLEEVTPRLEAQAPAKFKALRHFDTWHRTNVNRAYTQLEADF